jgi:hypothetical protein
MQTRSRHGICRFRTGRADHARVAGGIHPPREDAEDAESKKRQGAEWKVEECAPPALPAETYSHLSHPSLVPAASAVSTVVNDLL